MNGLECDPDKNTRVVLKAREEANCRRSRTFRVSQEVIIGYLAEILILEVVRRRRRVEERKRRWGVVDVVYIQYTVRCKHEEGGDVRMKGKEGRR